MVACGVCVVGVVLQCACRVVVLLCCDGALHVACVVGGSAAFVCGCVCCGWCIGVMLCCVVVWCVVAGLMCCPCRVDALLSDCGWKEMLCCGLLCGSVVVWL